MEAVSDLLAFETRPFPPAGLPCPPLMRECTKPYYNLICLVCLTSLGGEACPILKGKEVERILGREDGWSERREEKVKLGHNMRI